MDLTGRSYTFSIGFVEFLGGNKLRTTWGYGTYEFLGSNVYTLEWNKYYHKFTFSSDFTSYTSIRTRPVDNTILEGTYIQPMITSSPWVSCYLQGGIGNRLFQVASVLGFAEKWNRKPILYTQTNSTTAHQDNANILKLFPALELVTVPAYTKAIEEPPLSGFMYREIPSPDTNIVIYGYRQHPHYFPSYSIIPSFAMFSTFALKSILEKYTLTTTLERRKSWFIHIRLGDYCGINNMNHVTVDSYHRHLLHHIPPDANILILSNDSAKAAATLKPYLNRPFTVCDESSECMSLFIMQHCWGGAIIPNSTFSWWGAYFAYHSTPYKSSYKAYLPETWERGRSYDISNVPWGIPSSVL